MKRQLQLQIPTPCHEDWNKMDPAAKGRFCASCSKQVVDFTMMTDTEILSHLQKAKGNTCGRFSNDQLNRGLEPAPKRKNYTWRWLLTCISSMLVFRSDAQQKDIANPRPALTLAPVETKGETVVTLGMIAPRLVLPPTINGTVVDEQGQPIPGAVVAVTGTGNKTRTDKNGYFTMQAPGDRLTCTLNVAALGFNDKRILVDLKDKRPISTRIQLSAQWMGEVVVVSRPTRQITISGKVLDEKTNKPIPFAAVYIGENTDAKYADNAGRFEFTVGTSIDKLNLAVEALGFENEQGPIALSTSDEIEVLITMKPIVHELPELTVVSYEPKCSILTVGEVAIVNTNTVKSNTSTPPILPAIQIELPKTTPLSIYPNPALKGSTISIVMPEKDQWQIQLLDNNGVVWKTTRTSVTQKNTTAVFSIPAQLAGGMYYIQLINSKGQMASTGKLVIQ